MKKSDLILLISECISELLSESIISKPSNFKKVTIENFKKNENGTYSDWTGYGKILIPYVGWIPINRGTRKAKFTWLVKGVLRQLDISEYLRSIDTVNEIAGGVDYTPSITSKNPSIDSLIKSYAGDYLEFVNRGTAKFLDFGDHFSFSFQLDFPKSKVESKTYEELYKIVNKKLSFFKQEDDIYGQGKVKRASDSGDIYQFIFTVRGGK
jgi:hypothetical protein